MDLRGANLERVQLEQRPMLVGHRGGVTAVAFTPDGKYVFSGFYDKTVRQWSVESGECLAVLDRFPPGVSPSDQSAVPSGQYEFTSGGNNVLQLRLSGAQSCACLCCWL